MTLVTLEAAVGQREGQQGAQQPATRKRPAPQQTEPQEGKRGRPRRPRADHAALQAAGAEAPTAAAAAATPPAAAAPAAAAPAPAPDPAAAAARAAAAAAKAAEAERRGAELREAYQVFQEHAAERQLFMEVDAGGCCSLGCWPPSESALQARAPCRCCPAPAAPRRLLCQPHGLPATARLPRRAPARRQAGAAAPRGPHRAHLLAGR